MGRRNAGDHPRLSLLRRWWPRRHLARSTASDYGTASLPLSYSTLSHTAVSDNQDIDVRLYPLGDAEKLAIQKHADWALQKNAKKPYQIEIKIGPDKVKVDAVLVPLSDYTIFDKHKLIKSVEGINVANLALLAITKLETLAVRGNVIKLPNDYADLIWCLKECKKRGLVIPQEALDAGFPAGWTKMYTRLRRIVEPEEEDRLTKLLLDLGITPQVPP